MDRLNPNLLIYGGIGFLVLSLFWYQTGRLFLIGWMVKFLWLPINVICAVLWVFSAFIVNTIFDILRSYVLFVRLLSVSLIIACYYLFNNNNAYFIPLLMFSLLFFYLLKFGLNEERLYRWVFYSPKAKREPAPKPIKEHKKLIDDEKKAELLPRPIVRFLMKQQTNFETEDKIIEKLNWHLQQLIKRGLKP